MCAHQNCKYSPEQTANMVDMTSRKLVAKQRKLCNNWKRTKSKKIYKNKKREAKKYLNKCKRDYVENNVL